MSINLNINLKIILKKTLIKKKKASVLIYVIRVALIFYFIFDEADDISFIIFILKKRVR